MMKYAVAPHIRSKNKNYNFDPMQLCLFSIASTFIVFAFQIFTCSVATKNGSHLRHHTFQKSQKYLYSGKSIKKNFLQYLRCSNV